MARSGASARAAPHSVAGVRFVLDGKIVCPRALSPQRTVQVFRREHLVRTAIKEACSERGCGASWHAALPRHRPRLTRANGIAAIDGRAAEIVALALVTWLVQASAGKGAPAQRRVGTEA
jgi:hypothetical protein